MATDNENIEVDSEAHDEGFEFNPRTLIQDLRDFLLRNVRENGMKKPWQKMTEGEQKLEIERASDKAEALVRSIVDIVAQGNYAVVHAIVDNFKIKAGEVTITAKGIAEDDVVLTLNHAGKKAVKLIVADAQQFDQSRSNVPVDPDEPGLPGVKQEIQPEELGGGGAFDDDVAEVDEPAAFDDDAEQQEGAEILAPKSDQWRGGYNSRMAGHWREENPFKDGVSEAGDDWFDGWDAAHESGEGRSLNEKAIGQVASDSTEMIDADGEVQNGDIEGDAENGAADDATSDRDEEAGANTSGPADTLDEILPPIDGGTAQTQQPTLTDEDKDDLRAAGTKARKNGQAPKTNPYGKGTDHAALWLEGYNAEKAAEQKPKGDAPFDD